MVFSGLSGYLHKFNAILAQKKNEAGGYLRKLTLRLLFRLFSLLKIDGPRISQRPTYLLPHDSCSPFLKTQFGIPRFPSRFALFAQSGNNDDLIKESGEKERPNGFVNGDGGDFDSKKDRRPAFNFRRRDLLDPDPECRFIRLVLIIIFAKVEMK
ncbi:hypothetical protein SLA2020_297360 [Shorea laevis]